MQEATISGSFSSAITLKIPKTSYYVLELTEKDDRTSKSVSLSNIEAPLYARVDAIGAVLGTVRVAIPANADSKKEPDGIAYTVAEDPVELKLWSNDRDLLKDGIT